MADTRSWLLALFAYVAIVLNVASQRGWIVGAMAVVGYGVVFVPTAVFPRSVVAWSAQHPVCDRALLGPLLLLGLAGLTSWPLWVCLRLGLLGAAVSTGLGLRRVGYRAAR